MNQKFREGHRLRACRSSSHVCDSRLCHIKSVLAAHRGAEDALWARTFSPLLRAFFLISGIFLKDGSPAMELESRRMLDEQRK